MPLEGALCLRTDDVLGVIGDRRGFIPTSRPLIRGLNELNMWMIPRLKVKPDDEGGLPVFPPLAAGGLEHDPSFLQLIPYSVIFDHSLRYAVYSRTAGGEVRLDGKTSIGWGGHAQGRDLVYATRKHDAPEVFATCQKAAARELYEESFLTNVTLPSDLVNDLWFVGLLYDPSQPVNAVHLGFVFGHTAKQPEKVLHKQDDGGHQQVVWMDQAEIERLETLESWSRTIVESEDAQTMW